LYSSGQTGVATPTRATLRLHRNEPEGPRGEASVSVSAGPEDGMLVLGKMRKILIRSFLSNYYYYP